MKLNEVEGKKVIAIYPGRFQPFHRGHKKIYDFMCEFFPECYIATSNKTDVEKSPFSFDEKRKMMTFSGVDSERIIQARSPYNPKEILENYDPKNTIVIYIVSKKDMTGDNPRFDFAPKKDGSPNYYQPYDKKKLQTMDKHSYIMTIPSFVFPINGDNISSSTEIRKMFRDSNPNTQRKIIKDLFGEYDQEIHELMRKKLNILKSDFVNEAVDYHVSNSIPIRETIIRGGSKTFFDMINYIKENKNQFSLDEIDSEILETDIGEIAILEDGTEVPLDLPFFDDSITLEAEYQGKKVELNKPKRGGSKKFYVYVRDPKTKNVKKVSFGSSGMSVKANDPERVKSFVARHDCKNKNDKTKASYWSCRLPRYKSLGIKGGQWW